MYRLYQKNEVYFALAWIIIYCLVSIPIRGELGDESLLMVLGLALIAGVMTAFIKKYHLEEKYGLNKYPKNTRRYLYFIPVWILTTGNVWGGFKLSYTGLAQVWAVLSMLLVGYIEEVIFRGFLFKGMLEKDGPQKSIIIVSLTFGMGHFVNLLAGQASLQTITQVFFAIAWGFMLTSILYKSKSLFPCIFAHGMIDAFSKFGRESGTLEWVYIIATILVAVVYCPYLLKLKDEKKIPQNESFFK